MLIYFRDDEGDYLVEVERAAEILVGTADDTSELLISMAERAGVDLAWAGSRELETMQQTCARCPIREACGRCVAAGACTSDRVLCSNAVLFDLLWVRAAVEGGWLTAQHITIKHVA
jgi:Family of unknown function (DUF6455)